MESRFASTASLLIDVEHELRVLGLWETTQPSAEALASDQPFAVDTLSFTQWLQFVFIPKMTALIEQENLPDTCAVAPMAEEYFKQTGFTAGVLIGHLHAIDYLISA